MKQPQSNRIPRGDMVFLDANHFKERFSESILMPDTYRMPEEFARVIEAGPQCTVKKGDVVGFRMPFSEHVDGSTFSVIELNRKTVLVTYEPILQIKYRNMKEAIKAKQKGLKATMIKPLGRNMVIQIDKGGDTTKSGIKIPDFRLGVVPTIGRIVKMGDQATMFFKNPDELKIGDTIILNRKLSGGWLPNQMPGEETLFRTMSDSVLAVERDGEWCPIGGNIMAAGMWPDIEEVPPAEIRDIISGKTRMDQARWRIRGTKIIKASLPNPKMARVIKMGGGWSDKYFKQNDRLVDIHPDLEEGTVIWIPDLIQKNGKAMLGEVIADDNGGMIIMISSSFINCILKEDDIMNSDTPYALEMPDEKVRALVQAMSTQRRG